MIKILWIFGVLAVVFSANNVLGKHLNTHHLTYEDLPLSQRRFFNNVRALLEKRLNQNAVVSKNNISSSSVGK